MIDQLTKNLTFEYRTMYWRFWNMLSIALSDAYDHTEPPGTRVSLATYKFSGAQSIKEKCGSNKLIAYQSEPLVKNHWWSFEDIIEKIKGADEIWDYDIENIQILRNLGIEAKFRPPIYTESLKKVKNVDNPDIDVLFYGVLTPYRSKTMFDLVESVYIPSNYYHIFTEYNIVTLWNVHEDKLDDYIARSKIILNLNPYEGECRQQQCRLFYPLINNKCVLSQKNNINYYGDMIVEYSDTQDMFYKIMDLLDNDKWKQYTSNNFKEYSKKMIQNEGEMFLPFLKQ